jgi:hypothetical protein
MTDELTTFEKLTPFQQVAWRLHLRSVELHELEHRRAIGYAHLASYEACPNMRCREDRELIARYTRPTGDTAQPNPPLPSMAAKDIN